MFNARLPDPVLPTDQGALVSAGPAFYLPGHPRGDFCTSSVKVYNITGRRLYQIDIQMEVAVKTVPLLLSCRCAIADQPDTAQCAQRRLQPLCSRAAGWRRQFRHHARHLGGCLRVGARAAGGPLGRCFRASLPAGKLSRPLSICCSRHDPGIQLELLHMTTPVQLQDTVQRQTWIESDLPRKSI